jgi:hypothetical protein
MDASMAMTSYESNELFFTPTLVPETETKFETGLKMDMERAIRLNVDYYNNTTHNLVAPVRSGSQVILMNSARVNTQGVRLNLSGHFHFGNQNNLYVTFTWNKYNSVVKSLYSPDEYLALAGFSDVASVLATDQPLGAIYGTAYLKNNDGLTVVDSDGFPIVDTKLRMIGNPIPQWTGGVHISYGWKKIDIWTKMDLKYGGDKWNGTGRVLDYYGVSQTTADERVISNYVFDGVDLNGNANTRPVSFAESNGNTLQNRWVRDGYTGAAEQYIQDASWIRMNELGITWTSENMPLSFIQSLQLGLVARNLFLITRYKGGDPSSSLFGYANGYGLDLFNTPNTRGLLATMSVRF